MKIIGVEKSSFIDYPGRISTVFFTAGCNFHCSYCHNASIVEGLGEEIGEKEALKFINNRKKFIDAICISGGEPTLQRNLYEFIEAVKKEGFLVKLDTNGTEPHLLKRLIKDKLIDYIAMDIKAPLHKYEAVVARKVDRDAIKESISIIKKSDIDYEFRTTLCKELLTKEDMLEIANLLKGSKKYYIQNFRDGDTVLVGKNQLTPYSLEELRLIKGEIEGFFEACDIRGT